MSLLKTTLKKNDSLLKQPPIIPTPTPTPTPTPSPPVFTVIPSISPGAGQASSTTFTGTDGTVTGGSVTSRQWLLNGTSIGTGTTIAPTSAGTLIYQNTATGAGGTTIKNSNSVTVSPASGADPTLPPPVLTLAVSQTTYPPQLYADFSAQPLCLTTDTLHVQVATDGTAFGTIVLDTTLTVGSGAQTPNFSGFVSGIHYFRERIERGSAFGLWSNIIVHGDTTPPSLTSPGSSSVADNTATVSVTSSKANGTLYWTVLLASATAPTITQFLAGSTGGVASGSTNAPLAAANNFSATGLTAFTAYTVYFFQQDLAGNQSTVVSANFTTTQTTAATLTNPSAVNGGALSVSTNQFNGTFYWYVSTSSSAPTVANLKNGTGATSFGNQAITSTNPQTVSAGGLSDGVTYYGYLLQTNATSFDSTIASTGSFSGTADPTSFTTTNGTSKSTYLSVSGSPPLSYVGTPGVNATQLTRAIRKASAGQRAYEQTWNGTGGNGPFWMGWDDGTPDLSGFPVIGSDTHGISLSIDGGNYAIYYGSASPVQSGQGDPASLTSADTFTSNYDSVTGNVSFYRTRSGLRIQIGTTVTITPFTNAFAVVGDTGTLGMTANMGQSTFAYLATGYRHY